MSRLLLASAIVMLPMAAMAATCDRMTPHELLDSLTATNKNVLDVVTIIEVGDPLINSRHEQLVKCYAQLVTTTGEMQYNFTVVEIGGKSYVKGLGMKPWVPLRYDPIKPSDKHWWDYCAVDPNSEACISGKKRAVGK